MPSVDSSKPSVAFLIDAWTPRRGGAERALAQLAEHLVARGHRVLAVAEEHSADAPGELVAIASTGVTRWRRERDRARKLVAAARAHGAEVTIGLRHLYECDLYWPHGGAHAVSRRQARREAGWPGWTLPSPRHRVFLELERELLGRGGAKVVACVSRLVRDELAEQWPACRERLVIVENGVDLGRFAPSARPSAGAAFRKAIGVAPETPLLAFAARNPHLKGDVELEVALRELHRDGDADWRCVMAGYRAFAIGRGAREYERAQIVRREDVDALGLWSAADLCVHPTWRDTFGLGIVEALACGTPVVTTRFAGAAESIDEASGTVLDEPDPVELQGALASWLARIRSGGIDRAAIRGRVAHLDLARCHGTLERLVNELAGERRAANS